MSKAGHFGLPVTPTNGHDDRDRRWPVWASILFMLAASLALWALIVLGVLRLIELD